MSTGATPTLIGDFERIFPFDSATTAASDSIATASVLRAKAVAPLPVLFSQFAKTTVGAVRARQRARDKVVAERAKDPALPLRHAFAPTSLLPSPWTPDAIAAAVQRAKDAARNERARLGLPEPMVEVAQAADEAESKDEAMQIEQEIEAQRRAETNIGSTSDTGGDADDDDDDDAQSIPEDSLDEPPSTDEP